MVVGSLSVVGGSSFMSEGVKVVGKAQGAQKRTKTNRIIESTGGFLKQWG
jgi:hypothetical protein